MTEKGKPTGIRQEDVECLGAVNCAGRSAQLYRAVSEPRAGVGEGLLLQLDTGGTHLALYGYFAGDEFIELGRERVD